MSTGKYSILEILLGRDDENINMLRNVGNFTSRHSVTSRKTLIFRNTAVRTLCSTDCNSINAHLITNYPQKLTCRIHTTLLDGKVLKQNFSKQNRRWISTGLSFLVSFPFPDFLWALRLFWVKSDWHCWITETETSYIAFCDVNMKWGCHENGLKSTSQKHLCFVWESH